MNKQDEHKYDDIINLPHHVSQKHPQMSALNRAAQFSPFAALTGHEDAINETARLTDVFVELSDDKIEQLNDQLQILKENLNQEPECEITYFKPDEKKDGGSYVTVCGKIKKIDEYNHHIIFMTGEIISIYYIISIKGELLQNYDD